MLFLLFFVKVNALAHLILSHLMNLIHTYLFLFMPLFLWIHILFSSLLSTSGAQSISGWKDTTKEEILALE